MNEDCPVFCDIADLGDDIRMAGEELRERLLACRRCRLRDECESRQEFIDDLRQAVRELAAELRRG